MLTNQERASLVPYYTRAYLPLLLIALGLIFALIGASGVVYTVRTHWQSTAVRCAWISSTGRSRSTFLGRIP